MREILDHCDMSTIGIIKIVGYMQITENYIFIVAINKNGSKELYLSDMSELIASK
jgi:hypothetical protein